MFLWNFYSRRKVAFGEDSFMRLLPGYISVAFFLFMPLEASFASNRVSDDFSSRKKFDIVFCRGVLQHTIRPLDSLVKIHSFVKKDGLVIFDIYKMPKIGYLHPKYFFWRPLVKIFVKYELFEKFITINIKSLLKLKRYIKKIFFNSDFISDCIIPIWDYKNKLQISDKN